MIIKDVILSAEKQLISDFLQKFGLRYERDLDRSLYIEKNGAVVATVSSSKYIIKCLAVDPAYRNENYAAVLVSELIKRFHDEGIVYYQVFTKPEYRNVFKNLGFSDITETDKVCVLEGGDGDINSAINRLKLQLRFSLGTDGTDEKNDIGCVVVNGNPFTYGHLKLVEHIAAKHKIALVFVLEEEGSYFTFRERYAMAYLALKSLENVFVLPSTKYMVSCATFPGYFLKSVDETTEEYALYDASVFDKFFMPRLGICKRYVGTETSEHMKIYNNALKSVLGDRLEIVSRYAKGGETVSAGKVRELIGSGKTEEALEFIPRNNHALLRGMILSKNE